MPPSKGTKLRNYPSLPLEQAEKVAQLIQDQAAGNAVSKLSLADLLGRSPGSSEFERYVGASRMFGLTNDGSRSDQFALTTIGEVISGADEVARTQARREAMLRVAPYRKFLEAHNGKKLPAAVVFKEYLVKEAEVPESRAEECMELILQDAEYVGFIRHVKGGGRWLEIDTESAMVATAEDIVRGEALGDESEDDSDDVLPPAPTPAQATPISQVVDAKPSKVFIAHGKNRQPREQLKKMLDQFKVPYAVAVDEPHAGRPISAKVAQLMQRECSSGIFIFTADEQFTKLVNGEPVEVWRPSENVVYELGAASILYDNRIVIFKEDGVTFPSDFSDLGYITFKPEQLVERMGDLFGELVKLDILEVRAKG